MCVCVCVCVRAPVSQSACVCACVCRCVRGRGYIPKMNTVVSGTDWEGLSAVNTAECPRQVPEDSADDVVVKVTTQHSDLLTQKLAHPMTDCASFWKIRPSVKISSFTLTCEKADPLCVSAAARTSKPEQRKYREDKMRRNSNIVSRSVSLMLL